MLNVFEHQRFIVRTSDGTRTSRSFRELITATADDGRPLDPDESLTLDYPHVFFNIGTMGLIAYLMHVAFEPADGDELALRLRQPIPTDEYEAAVGPLRQRFTIDGDGASRFMQGPPPTPDSKGKLARPDDVSTILLTVRKDNSLNKMEWLNRPDTSWAIALDQIPLLLFTRNTFYEGAGGAGYQKGTAGEVPIRTLLLQHVGDGLIDLRRSAWLNVLHRRYQRDVFSADFAIGRPGYDGFMWEALPPDDVPTGGLTLRAGLGWMAAFHHLKIEDVPEDHNVTCMVTGHPLTGRAATGVWKGPTGIAYGAKGDEEAGTRASRLFRHPNVPTYALRDRKTGDYGPERQLTVHRTRGLVDALGALFFGKQSGDGATKFEAAPIIEQLINESESDLEEYYRSHRADLDMDVFGFHMIGAMGGKHSAYEHGTFRYPLLKGSTPAETNALLREARLLMHDAAEQANAVARLFQRALQETAGVAVKWEVDDKGRLSVKPKEKKSAAEFDFGRDTLAAYWQGVGDLIRRFVAHIAERGRTVDSLAEAHSDLLHDWGMSLAGLARRLYRPHFEQYSTQSKTMPFAHRSARRFYGTLKQITSALAEPAESND